MTNLLFVVCSYSRFGAQAIRFKNLIEHLGPEYNSRILELGEFNNESRDGDRVLRTTIKYSKLCGILNPAPKAAKANSNLINRPSFKNYLPIGFLKRKLRSLFFPDSYVFEHFRLRNAMRKLLNEESAQFLVLSASPFSVLLLAPFIKSNWPSIKVVFDIGDPFSKNAVHSHLKNWMARIFEGKYLQYIDMLIVTNEATKNYYKQTFHKELSDAKVELLFMGLSDSKLKTMNFSNDKSTKLNFVYAGQLYMRLREPFELYRAFSLIKNELSDIHLNMYGQFNQQYYSNWVSESSISFHGKVSNDEVYEAYSNCDVIVFIDNAFGIQTPGKIFEVLAIGKPILFISDNQESHSRQLVGQFDHVVFCKNVKQEICDAIRQIQNIKSLDENALFEVRKEFSWKNRSKEFQQILSLLS